MNDELAKAKKVARDKYLRSMKKSLDTIFKHAMPLVVISRCKHEKKIDKEIADFKYMVYEADDPDLIAHFEKRKAEYDAKCSLR